MLKNGVEQYTISDIKAINRENGFHFFDRSTMRFFDSRNERVYNGPGGCYFVTSEQFHGSNNYTAARKYTVREFNPTTGACKTVGSFNEMSREGAMEAARELAKHGGTETAVAEVR